MVDGSEVMVGFHGEGMIAFRYKKGISLQVKLIACWPLNMTSIIGEDQNWGRPDSFRFGDRFGWKEPTGKLADARRTFQYFNWLVAAGSLSILQEFSRCWGNYVVSPI